MEHALWLGGEAGGGGCVLLWRAAVAKGADSGDACAAEDAVAGNGITNTAAE